MSVYLQELKPPPPSNGTAGPPSAQLNSNCTLVVTDSTGKVTWTSNTTSTNGPCSLITLDNQGQLQTYIAHIAPKPQSMTQTCSQTAARRQRLRRRARRRHRPYLHRPGRAAACA